MGLFTCPKRVERNGYLVAFEGEIMSEDDARKRGLLADGAPANHETPAAAESNDDDAANAPADDDNDGQDASDAAEPVKKAPAKKATTKATTKK